MTLPILPFGSPAAAGEQCRGAAAEHQDGHGSTRRKQDPAEGRQENPRGDQQEKHTGGHDVRRRYYMPPRLVTSDYAFTTHIKHTFIFIYMNLYDVKLE